MGLLIDVAYWCLVTHLFITTSKSEDAPDLEAKRKNEPRIVDDKCGGVSALSAESRLETMTAAIVVGSGANHLWSAGHSETNTTQDLDNQHRGAGDILVTVLNLSIDFELKMQVLKDIIACARQEINNLQPEYGQQLSQLKDFQLERDQELNLKSSQTQWPCSPVEKESQCSGHSLEYIHKSSQTTSTANLKEAAGGFEGQTRAEICLDTLDAIPATKRERHVGYSHLFKECFGAKQIGSH